MYSEANRRETFTSWPHAGYRWAQPDPMAQAGFYHQVGWPNTPLLMFMNVMGVFCANQAELSG